MKDQMSDRERITRQSYALPAAVEIYSHDQLMPLEAYVIKAFLSEPGHILELGCGAGRLTGHVKGAGKVIVASDISMPMLERAKQRLPDVTFVCADACVLPHPSEHFDAVFFGFNGLDCLLPFDRRRQCLREIYRVLLPGGRLIFSSHNRWFLGSYFPTSRYRAGALRDNLLKGCLWRHYRFERHPGGQEFFFAAVSPPAQIRELASLGFQDIQVVDPFCVRRLESVLSPYLYYVCRKPPRPPDAPDRRNSEALS